MSEILTAAPILSCVIVFLVCLCGYNEIKCLNILSLFNSIDIFNLLILLKLISLIYQTSWLDIYEIPIQVSA